MTKAGPQVELGKVGGLFRKSARPNRYLWISAVGSGSDGLDLMGIRSNRSRRLRIERRKGFGPTAAAQVAGIPLSHGGVRGIPPEFAKTSTPGVNAAWFFWFLVKNTKCVNHWGDRPGPGRSWYAVAPAGWVATRRSAPEFGLPATAKPTAPRIKTAGRERRSGAQLGLGLGR